MNGCQDNLAFLVEHFQLGEGLVGFLLNPVYRLFAGQRIAEKYRADKAEPVIAVGSAGNGAVYLLLDFCGSGAADGEGKDSMDNTRSVHGVLHKLFVEMHLAVVCGDAAEQIYVCFRYRLGK